MSESNVTNLDDHRPKVPLLPYGVSDDDLGKVDWFSRREMTAEEIAEVVRKVQDFEVHNELDEAAANRQVPLDFRFSTRNIPLVEALLAKDPHRRWAVMVRMRNLYFVNRPLAFAQHKTAHAALLHALVHGTYIEVQVANLNAWMRWEKAYSVLDPSFDDQSLLGEQPVPPDEDVVGDVRRSVARLKAKDIVSDPALSGCLHHIVPEQF